MLKFIGVGRMMNKFIEIKCKLLCLPYFINVSNLTYVRQHHHRGSEIRLVDGSILEVIENASDIMKLIEGT